MADSLGKDLADLEDVRCVHFEQLVALKGPPGYLPKCVDCMARSRNKVYLIEFKPIPARGKSEEERDDIPCSLALKALESAMICHRFILPTLDEKLELGFILVVQNPRQEIVSTYQRSKPGLPKELERYKKRDVDGNVMFYDTVEMYGCVEFVQVARRRFQRSTGPEPA